jgi:hypothetical protein
LKTLAVLVLALVWVGLFVMWIRSRAQEGSFSDPVGTFNRHLRILENTAPTRFPAANSRRPGTGTIAPYRPASSAGLGPMTDSRRVRPSSAAARRRVQSRKRRRDVFFALVAGVIGSLVLGLIPGLHVMLYIQGLFDVLTAVYVFALVSMRNRAAERDAKLAYLGPSRRARSSQPQAAYGQARSYAAEAYGDGYAPVVSGYDDTYGDGYSYGDLRRAAN